MDDHPASRRDESWTISGNLVDPLRRAIRPATLTIAGGRIASITDDSRPHATWLLPGFVDAHVHVESSLLPPAEFARLAVAHGTVATVSDPHEIANVLGIPGVEFMLDDARQSPFTFHFGAPSCVPATPFDHAGAVIDAAGVAALLDRPEIGYLSEMMNYPGVIAGDRQVLAKIAAAKARGKPVDGHAPRLRGAARRRRLPAREPAALRQRRAHLGRRLRAGAPGHQPARACRSGGADPPAGGLLRGTGRHTRAHIRARAL